MQRIAGRGVQVRSDAGGADHAGLPADAGNNQQAIFGWNMLHHLAVVRLQRFGGQLRGAIQQFGEIPALQAKNSQFRKDLLLTNPQAERTHRKVGR